MISQRHRSSSRKRKSRKLRGVKPKTRPHRALRSRRPRRRLTGGFSCDKVLAAREANTLKDPNYYQRMTLPSKIKYQVCKHLLSRKQYREASMARKAELYKFKDKFEDAKRNLTEMQKEQRGLQQTLQSEITARDETVAELKDALQKQRVAAQTQNDSDKALVQTYINTIATNASRHEEKINELHDSLKSSEKITTFYRMQFDREQVRRLPRNERRAKADISVRTSAFNRVSTDRGNAVSTYLQTGTIPARYKGNLRRFLDPDST